MKLTITEIAKRIYGYSISGYENNRLPPKKETPLGLANLNFIKLNTHQIRLPPTGTWTENQGHTKKIP